MDLTLLPLDSPTETRSFEKGRFEVYAVGPVTVGRASYEPGWRWSEHVKPVAGTELCQAPHQQYQISGRIHVVMADGTELESGPGDVTTLPPGHDAWVVGDEPAVVVDWHGASVWAARG